MTDGGAVGDEDVPGGGVRDSKDVSRPHFAVAREEWSRFVGFVTAA
ncbi:DUF397 domain-containing protein [Streptomyces asiaticus]